MPAAPHLDSPQNPRVHYPLPLLQRRSLWSRRGVAQPGSARRSGRRGRRFESSRPDHSEKASPRKRAGGFSLACLTFSASFTAVTSLCPLCALSSLRFVLPCCLYGLYPDLHARVRHCRPAPVYGAAQADDCVRARLGGAPAGDLGPLARAGAARGRAALPRGPLIRWGRQRAGDQGSGRGPGDRDGRARTGRMAGPSGPVTTCARAP